MDSKPTIEQFIYDCFRERTAALKLQLEIHYAFWRRFHCPECRWDGRRKMVERSEGEKILSVSPSDTGTDIVTTGETIYRSRYHVKPSGESWLIQEVDMECSLCRTVGVSTACTVCDGTGWQTWKNLCATDGLTRRRQDLPWIRLTDREEESENKSLHNATAESFMTDYFQERTLSWKKEASIQTDYAERFYSPEFDWTRWQPPIQKSETESIVNIAAVDTGLHIITNGIQRWRLRYDLRPVEQSWLIWEVDLECPVCSQRGPDRNCFLCGGTIWDRKKRGEDPTRGEPPDEELPPERPRW